MESNAFLPDIPQWQIYCFEFVFYIGSTCGITAWAYYLPFSYMSQQAYFIVCCAYVVVLGTYFKILINKDQALYRAFHSLLAMIMMLLVFLMCYFFAQATAPTKDISILNIHEYSQFRHFRFSDGEIMEKYAFCTAVRDGSKEQFFALAPLVTSSEGFVNGSSAVPAFVATEDVNSSCEVESSANWNQAIRQGTLLKLNISRTVIPEEQTNIFILWENINHYTPPPKKNAFVIAGVNCGVHCLIGMCVICCNVDCILPKSKYEEIDM